MNGTDTPEELIIGHRCKPIPMKDPFHKGKYFASIEGEIISKARRQPIVMRQTENSTGYKMVNLGQKMILTHHAVAYAWLGPRPSKAFLICHTDDVKTNNRVDNLHYGPVGRALELFQSPSWHILFPVSNYVDREFNTLKKLEERNKCL